MNKLCLIPVALLLFTPAFADQKVEKEIVEASHVETPALDNNVDQEDAAVGETAQSQPVTSLTAKQQETVIESPGGTAGGARVGPIQSSGKKKGSHEKSKASPQNKGTAKQP